jgi:hypothetical protein
MWISLWWSSHSLSWYPPKSCKTLWCSYASVSSASVLQNTSAQDPLDSATRLVLWLDSTPLQSRPLHQKPGSCKRIKGYQGTRQRKPTMTKHMVENSLSTIMKQNSSSILCHGSNCMDTQSWRLPCPAHHHTALPCHTKVGKRSLFRSWKNPV